MAKKRIFLTEKQIETIKNRLLTENRESKNMSKARNLLYQQGYSQEDAQKTIEAIRNDIPNVRLADCKFLPGVTRMYLNRELSDGNAIMKLNKTLKYVASDAHVNEYDNSLNGMSVNELVQRFAGVQQQDADASRAESYSKQFTRNNDYTIVRIPDAKTAAKYGRYTSWCVTHDKRMYNSYTADSTGLFYFCFRNGFENEQPIESEGCPLDSYGLSMIAVSVTLDGELNTCTCRWNHDNGGNDNIMDKAQIEELLGVNFYEVFKPYTRDELHAKGKILFDEVPELLAQGKKPEEIFEDIDDFSEGYARVELNNKYNFINTNGELVSPNQWFDFVTNFSVNGYAVVRLNNKCNFINTNGELVSPNQWFDFVTNFFINGYAKGHAKVKLNNKLYLLRFDGVLCDYDTLEPLPNQQIVSETKKIKRIFLTENQVSELQQKIQKAREETDKNPTEGQKEAGNYKMGRVNVFGFNIAIENPKGSYRKGKDRTGKEWKTLMHNDYGYFTHTLAIDGDAVDVFLGDDLNCKTIFAIDQKINGKFDETKVMLGFKSSEDAKKAYLSNYEKDWKGFWKITEVDIDVFKKWLYDGYQQRKPFFEYAEIKKEKLNETLLNENDEWHAYYDYLEKYDEYTVLRMIINNQNLWAPLIQPAMYQQALNEFTKFGRIEKFPAKYIHQWIGIIMKNTAILRAITSIAGHDMGYPTSQIIDACFNSEEEFEQYKQDLNHKGEFSPDFGWMGQEEEGFNEEDEVSDDEAACQYLEDNGYFERMTLPDGSPAWSDYGIQPLEKIILEYSDTLGAEQVLVLINRALDVTHQRGDLASAFIEGGAETLSQISNRRYLTEHYNQEWELEEIQKNQQNGFIKLYHNTRMMSLADIIYTGELDVHQHHSEGHGNMLFFTVHPEAWGNECKISIEVPISEFTETGRFRFVNSDSVITEENIPISEFNFKIEKIQYFDYDRIKEILTGDDMELKEYLLLKYFQEYDYMWWIKQWFLNNLGLKEEDLL